MRTVAHALGTGAASLYAHVTGKEELLEIVVERVIGEVPLAEEEPDPSRWQEQLERPGCARSAGCSRGTVTSRAHRSRGFRSARTRCAAASG